MDFLNKILGSCFLTYWYTQGLKSVAAGCYRFGDPLNEEADSLHSDDEDHSTGRGEDDSDEFADDEGMSNQEDSSSQEYLDDSNYLDDDDSSHRETYSQFLAPQPPLRIRSKYTSGNMQ